MTTHQQFNEPETLLESLLPVWAIASVVNQIKTCKAHIEATQAAIFQSPDNCMNGNRQAAISSWTRQIEEHKAQIKVFAQEL